MMHFLSCRSVTVLSAVLAVVASVTPETYYECEQYTGDQWEQIDKTRRKCIRETVGGEDLLFCRHWECEQPKCPEAEQITSEDGCKSCPGFCSSGGKSYPEGKSFTCADNVNSCTCMAGGGLASTRMGYFRQSLCNAPSDLRIRQK